MLQPKRIKGRDLEILSRHLLGMSNKDIALDLGISETTVSQKINSDWFRNELAEILASTVTKIANGQYSPMTIARAHALEAMNKNIDLMRQARSERVAQLSAWDILDRAGYKAPQKVEVVDVNDLFDRMTADELDDYASTGQLPARFSNQQNLLGGGTNTVQ